MGFKSDVFFRGHDDDVDTDGLSGQRWRAVCDCSRRRSCQVARQDEADNEDPVITHYHHGRAR
jgi:hypothetical protein